ncbi:MAG: tetratricopeptide repeat protein, partial [Planctomycetota bacterium]
MRVGFGAAVLALLLQLGCSGAETSTTPSPSAENVTLEKRALDASIAQVEVGELSDGIRALEGLRNSATLEMRVEALRWLGHAHTRNFDPEAALAAYREALVLAPQDPWLHYATGTAQFTIGDLEEAIAS